MKRTGLILILIIIMGILPIQAQTENYFEIDNGLKLRLYKDTAGYDTILKPDDTPLVYSQRYTIEYLDGPKWKQITVPFSVTENVDIITRHYTDYLGTTAEVIYRPQEDSIKTDVVINSAQTREYRIKWSLDGITNTDYTVTENGVNFTGPDDWVLLDWTDAFNQYGDITDYTVSDSANGKKLDVTFNIGTIEAGKTFTLDPRLYFQQLGTDSTTNIYETHWGGQTFTTTNAFNITILTLRMYRVGDPGNITVGIRATDGLGHPTGSDLVTATYNVSGITANVLGSPYNITLDSTALSATTKYAIVVRALGTAFPATYVGLKYKAGGAFANGNLETSVDSGTSWASSAADDATFAIYGNAYPEVNQLDADTTFSRDTPGWLNFTISDDDGVADFATFTIQVNTSGDVNNFTLRWTQATNLFSEVSDPDGIVVLNAASARTNINATHDFIRFNFNITGGQSGLCDVLGTVVDDDGYVNTTLFNSAFTFSYFNWVEEVYDWINSAFEQFGIIDYMGSITVFLTGLTTWFNTSLTRMLALLVQQFEIITAVYDWFIYWTTAVIDIVLQFSTYYHEFLDGTSAWGDGLAVWWNLISGFFPLFPVMGLILWFDSLETRGRQTVGGATQVFLNDINTAIGLISYFFGVFSFVANTIIDRVYGLFDAVT